MSRETEERPSGWTVDTLRAHVTDRIDEHDKRYEQRFLAQESAVQAALVAQEKAVNAALIAADRAVIKAEVAADKRFDATNEFRQQLADQTNTFVTREVLDTIIEALASKVATLSEWRAWMLGAGAILGLLAGAIGGAIAWRLLSH